jgi:hypothetical protein
MKDIGSSAPYECWQNRLLKSEMFTRKCGETTSRLESPGCDVDGTKGGITLSHLMFSR